MSENKRPDNPRRIIDENQDDLMLVTKSMPNSLMFKLQINIQSFFTPDPKFSKFNTSRFSNPTPLQYAIIVNKPKSLQAVLNFMVEDVSQLIGDEGLPKELKFFFCPDVSNTTWPLIHLAIGLEQFDCLQILITFLESKGEKDNFINLPDDNKRTPLAIAFATGNNQIIDYLIDKGADPFYGVDKEVYMPFIYTCLRFPDQAENTLQCIKDKCNLDCTILEKLQPLFYSEVGLAFSNNDGNRYSDFTSFVDHLSSDNVRNIFNSMQSGEAVISTGEDNNTENRGQDSTQSKPSNTCAFNGCNRKGKHKCDSCSDYFCDEHIQIHGC